MKQISFLIAALFFAMAGFSQTTYYWVGGTAATSFTNLSNFNTMLDGSGTARVIGATNDILIFDGSNVGGATPTTGTVTAQVSGTSNIFQLKLQNAANVVLQRAATGTGTINVNGDGTTAPDFVVPVGNNLTINNIVPAASTGSIVTVIAAAATGVVGGNITIEGDGGSRISPIAAGGLQFQSGSIFNSNATPVSTSAYPFGNATTQSTVGGVVFNTGANLNVNGNKSPFAGTSTSPTVFMLPGSNYYQRAPRGDGSYVNSKAFGNFFVQNNTAFVCDGTIFKLENLTVENGSTFITHTSGQTPVLGNLVVSGSLTAPAAGSTNTLIMGGNAAQTISGPGIIDVPNFTVANSSNVTLQKNITVGTNPTNTSPSVNIVGTISFNNTAQFLGDAGFTSRVNGSATDINGSVVAGSYYLAGGAGILSGNNGLKISGPGITPGTNVVGFSGGGGYVNLSQPATATTSGTYTFSSDSATLSSANPNGFDSTSGSVIVTGTKSYQSGTNYIVNTTSNSPFGISSSAPSGMTLGNLTLNAAATTNYNLRINGTLTLNAGILTIRSTDTVRLLTPTPIGGGPFSVSKYISTQTNGVDVGGLRVDNISSPYTFPVGSNLNYLPTILVPVAPADYVVGVFKGATSTGTPSGTQLTPAQKSGIVDAVWTIGQLNGTGDCTLTLNWDNSLEGTTFSTYADNEIGIAQYDGSMYGVASGNGNQSLNFATSTFSTFSPFIVSKTGTVLPVKLLGLYAKFVSTGVQVNWNVANEAGTLKYEVEKSVDGRNFTLAGIVSAAGRNTYSYIDQVISPASTIYYRLKISDINGKITYSDVVILKQGNNVEISVYPNPAVSIISVAGLAGKGMISVISIDGKTLMQLPVNANSMSVNVDKLPAGTYILQVAENNQRHNIRFTKE